MKKIALLIGFFMTLMMLSGCYPSGYTYGQLMDITFHTTEGDVINGEFVDDDIWFYQSIIRLSSSISRTPLNSPKPINLYYTAEVDTIDSIIVRFKVKGKNGFTFNGLSINESIITEDMAYNTEMSDGFLYVDILINDLDAGSNLYQIDYILFEKEIDGENKVVRGSTWYEGPAYIRGFRLNVTDEE